MGKTSRERPLRLPEKLRQIRINLDLSQSEILNRLGLDEKLFRSDISKYEIGVREPSLITLLAYAKLYNISTDFLIDDNVDLPKL